RPAPVWRADGGRIAVPVTFMPYGSRFVVFRKPLPEKPQPLGKDPAAEAKLLITLQGNWVEQLGHDRGGPAQVRFDSLVSWTARPEEGIRHYSGAAIYRKRFRYDGPRKGSLRLQLNAVKDMGIARVTLNGKDLGVVWTPPFSVDV